MGTSVFAEEILASLIEAQYDIVGVCTQTNKKVGRSQEVQKSPVKITAEKNALRIFEPQKFDEKTVAQLASLQPDLIIVAAYGKILPVTVLNVPRLGAINVHASLLPKYRGPSPIQNAILDGKVETGITIMLMDAGIDTGKIIAQEKIAIKSDETTPELSKRLANLAVRLLLKTIPLYAKGKIVLRKQNNNEETLCQILKKSDGQINWNDSAESIYNRYRAFFPWPGIFTFWKTAGAAKRLKLLKINFQNSDISDAHQIGEVFQFNKRIAIQTGNGKIILEKLQLEGKVPMTIKEFLNGHFNFLNSILK